MVRSGERMGRAILLAVVCGGLALTTRFAVADDKKYPAIADLSRVDADYALQGEFRGQVPANDPNGKVVALQIRANGKGRFLAAQFDHGLPGEVPNSKRLAWLSGKRYGDLLVLSGGPWAVLVHPEDCLLIDAAGQTVGQIPRVRRESPTLGASPPKQATVLFDGSNTNNFVNAQLTDTGLLMQGTNLLPMYQDFDLHLEFILPYMPTISDQMRANSGVYMQSRYELQILDSFAMSTTFNGCGSLYRYRKPDVNMCLPPLVWQTYDISFTGPRWASDGQKLKNARVTVWLNGVKVQNNVEIETKTGNGAPEEVALLPIKLQEHGAPVRFRNIWIVDRGADGWVEFPVLSTEEEKAKAHLATGALCPPPAPKEAPAVPPAASPAESAPAPAPAVAAPSASDVKPPETAPAEAPPPAMESTSGPAPAPAPEPSPAPVPASESAPAPAPTPEAKTS